MRAENPEQVGFYTYALVALWAVVGGTANYLHRVKSRKTNKFSLLEFSADALYSGFSGLLTFFACSAQEIDPMTTAALVGVAGHMGARLVYAVERFFVRAVERNSGD